MSRHILSELEHSERALVVANEDVLAASRVDTHRCKLELSCAPIATFALERQRFIEALGDVDVVELPPVAVVPPHEDRQVSGAGHKALTRLVNE